MMENFEIIIYFITMIISWVLGIVSKKNSFINNNLIPLQNLIIGIISTLIVYICTGNFEIALTISGLTAGGAYDIFHNIKKMIEIQHQEIVINEEDIETLKERDE